jgi:hypothetical protein
MANLGIFGQVCLFELVCNEAEAGNLRAGISIASGKLENADS